MASLTFVWIALERLMATVLIQTYEQKTSRVGTIIVVLSVSAFMRPRAVQPCKRSCKGPPRLASFSLSWDTVVGPDIEGSMSEFQVKRGQVGTVFCPSQDRWPGLEFTQTDISPFIYNLCRTISRLHWRCVQQAIPVEEHHNHLLNTL